LKSSRSLAARRTVCRYCAWSVRLNDREAVPVRVAEEELRWHGIPNRGLDRDKPRPAPALARNLRVHMHAPGSEGCVESVDVFCRECAMGLVAARGFALTWWDQRDRVSRARRGHFDPAIAPTVDEFG